MNIKSKMLDSLIFDTSSALFLLSLNLLIRNSLCKEGAKEVTNKRVQHFIK